MGEMQSSIGLTIRLIDVQHPEINRIAVADL